MPRGVGAPGAQQQGGTAPNQRVYTCGGLRHCCQDNCERTVEFRCGIPGCQDRSCALHFYMDMRSPNGANMCKCCAVRLFPDEVYTSTVASAPALSLYRRTFGETLGSSSGPADGQVEQDVGARRHGHAGTQPWGTAGLSRGALLTLSACIVLSLAAAVARFRR